MVTCTNCGAGPQPMRHFCANCGVPMTAAGAEIDQGDPLASPMARGLWEVPPPTVEQVPTLEQPPLPPAPHAAPAPMGHPHPMPQPAPAPPPRPIGYAYPAPQPAPPAGYPYPMAPPPMGHPYPMASGPPRPGPVPMPAPYPMAYPVMPVYAPPKSKAAAALLAFFLGGLGIHRFYLGHAGLGATYLILFFLGFFTFGLTWIAVGVWALVDFVLILCGAVSDSYGRPLT